MKLEEDERRLNVIETIVIAWCIGWHALVCLWQLRKQLNGRPISESEHKELLRRMDDLVKDTE